MVKIRKYDDGFEIHGPPYTKGEESEFYGRAGKGPKAVATSERLGGRKTKKPPATPTKAPK